MEPIEGRVTDCIDCGHRKHAGRCPEFFPEENGPACGCHRPAVAECKGVPPFVLLRVAGGHWHVSTRCPMIDSSEYFLALREDIEDRRPCSCTEWPR